MAIRTLRYRADSRHYRMLEEISAGELFVGFLSSSRSTRLMFRTARKLAQVRYKNKITLIELEEQGYIRRSHKHGETSFFITKDGKRRLHDVYKQTSHYVQHPEKWDGSWRVISYDFPEQQRSQRNSLRYVLTKSGFLKIQKSIWIFPYEVPLLISLLSEDPIISACCVYMKSAGLTGEARYKMYFKLK